MPATGATLLPVQAEQAVAEDAKVPAALQQQEGRHVVALDRKGW